MVTRSCSTVYSTTVDSKPYRKIGWGRSAACPYSTYVFSVPKANALFPRGHSEIRIALKAWRTEREAVVGGLMVTRSCFTVYSTTVDSKPYRKIGWGRSAAPPTPCSTYVFSVPKANVLFLRWHSEIRIALKAWRAGREAVVGGLMVTRSCSTVYSTTVDSQPYRKIGWGRSATCPYTTYVSSVPKANVLFPR